MKCQWVICPRHTRDHNTKSALRHKIDVRYSRGDSWQAQTEGRKWQKCYIYDKYTFDFSVFGTLIIGMYWIYTHKHGVGRGGDPFIVIDKYKNEYELQIKYTADNMNVTGEQFLVVILFRWRIGRLDWLDQSTISKCETLSIRLSGDSVFSATTSATWLVTCKCTQTHRSLR